MFFATQMSKDFRYPQTQLLRIVMTCEGRCSPTQDVLRESLNYWPPGVTDSTTWEEMQGELKLSIFIVHW